MLTRLLDEGCLTADWEDGRAANDEKRPPRRYYQLTDEGREKLGAVVEWARGEPRFAHLLREASTGTGTGPGLTRVLLRQRRVSVLWIITVGSRARESAESTLQKVPVGFFCRPSLSFLGCGARETTSSTLSVLISNLPTALAYAQHAPTVVPWLASMQATICADSGDHATAAQALDRAKHKTAQSGTQAVSLIDHGPAYLLAPTGHVHLHAGDHDAARAALTAALDQLPPTARRSRILTLVDLATTEVRASNLADASRHALTAVDLVHTTTYATGTIRLRAFRASTARPLDPQTLRALDHHLAHLAA